MALISRAWQPCHLGSLQTWQEETSPGISKVVSRVSAHRSRREDKDRNERVESREEGMWPAQNIR